MRVKTWGYVSGPNFVTTGILGCHVASQCSGAPLASLLQMTVVVIPQLRHNCLLLGALFQGTVLTPEFSAEAGASNSPQQMRTQAQAPGVH